MKNEKRRKRIILYDALTFIARPLAVNKYNRLKNTRAFIYSSNDYTETRYSGFPIMIFRLVLVKLLLGLRCSGGGWLRGGRR